MPKTPWACRKIDQLKRVAYWSHWRITSKTQKYWFGFEKTQGQFLRRLQKAKGSLGKILAGKKGQMVIKEARRDKLKYSERTLALN